MLESIRNTKNKELWNKQSNSSLDGSDVAYLLRCSIDNGYLDLVEKALDWFDIERSDFTLKEKIAFLQLGNSDDIKV